MSFFEHISLAPQDPIFGLIQDYRRDPRPNKLTFIIGFYRDDQQITPVMNAVKQAERVVFESQENKEYLPIDGDPDYIGMLGELIFGNPLWQEYGSNIYGAQTVGGTGALRILADFFRQELNAEIWISDPSWPNHEGIFKRAGFSVKKYPYFDRERKVLEFDRMKSCFETLSKGSIVMLHACCHNPTGIDLTIAQWTEISEIFLKRQLLPFFDFAYQGFGKGIVEDAASIHQFIKAGHEIAIAYSCAKNFSLYGERVAALFILSKSSKNLRNVQSQIKGIVRSSYSNPPKHGAAIVREVLRNPALKKQWEKELDLMRKRMQEIRFLFVDALRKKNPEKQFQFISDSLGLFSYTGLNREQVEKLRSDFAIYMPSDGRINITGINEKNLEHIVNSITSVI